ncbi:pentapeptide repeat-containing protein [Amycolatopsis samaneae]|uniref:Pentapeptide repeat-containing protein n=1 Tax=Amycolatopsis samaneae TaxID=664691 RepID=A0ABW5GKK3_9PSEU
MARMPGLGRWWRGRRGTWWWAIVVIVVPVAVVAGTAVTLLLSFVDAGDPKNQIELIRTGLTVGAGTGGVVALVLAGRRQWSTEHDAAERRMTELYVKAVEQLGSDKAAVRHGGLYALERVAQDNPDHRQTVVNVLCAYLRAPFTPPGEPRPRQRRGIRRPLAPASCSAMAQVGQPEELTVAELDDEARQEREVRLTAQRILAAHLQPGEDPGHPVATFWADIDLDLTGATLIDFNLSGTRLRAVTCTTAHFIGDAWFDGASFLGDALFDEAGFTGDALFSRTGFAKATRFNRAGFAKEVSFNRATFVGDASFNRATFAEEAWFNRTIFREDASFNRAAFTKDAWFTRTIFSEDAWFSGTGFTKAVWFTRATFLKEALFGGADFRGDTLFDDVTFHRPPDFGGAGFERTVPEPLRTQMTTQHTQT